MKAKKITIETSDGKNLTFCPKGETKVSISRGVEDLGEENGWKNQIFNDNEVLMITCYPDFMEAEFQKFHNELIGRKCYAGLDLSAGKDFHNDLSDL